MAAKSMISDVHFSSEKARVLSKVDLSRKGSVDEPIAELVCYVTALNEIYTTSSCSGRLVVMQEDSEQRKKGCHWWLMSHDQISHQQLESSLSSAVGSGGRGNVYFKFEPFVLHVMCRTLEDAQTMMQAAVSSGFRNSGISCGKKGKIMVAVRSTQCLEVPVIHGGSILVSSEYLKHLVELGNTKMQENLQRIERFVGQLKELTTETYVVCRSKAESGNAQRTTTQKIGKAEAADSNPKDISRLTESEDHDILDAMHDKLDIGKLLKFS